MAGSRNRMVRHDFYCINCGKKGIPVWRKAGSLRARDHRKALYCTTCKMTVNHIEVTGPEEEAQFIADFEEGKYREEAEESVAYADRK